MDQKQLGKDGPLLTEIGLGTWAIGGPWSWGWGPQDDKVSIKTIHKALDRGINWIDTAAAYGLGHGEEVVGKAVEGIRKEVFIATKCGLVWNEKRRVRNNIQPDSILEEAEASLRRLNTDYIDLYQIHWPDGQTPVEKSWEAMVKLKNQGKVRFIGVSNFDKSMLEKCEKIFHVNSLQPPYSLLNREVEKEILPWCKVHGIGVVAYSPMQSGLLTDSFDISRLAPDDWRHKSSYFQEPNLSKNLEFTKRLGEIAARYNKTVAQLAIAWVLNNSVVSSAIVGARKPEQVDEIVGGAAWSITREDLDLIENLSTEIL
jgi:aryl-alcohol dehydrogenase-like predicted oxidoreductase